MWVFEQSSGRLSRSNATLTYGYSGNGLGKNDPEMQDIKDVGPIPQGLYTIGPPQNSPTHGPFAMALTPDPDNQMFGRSEFLIHGDSLEHPGLASDGCIIADRISRLTIWGSGDRLLKVVETLQKDDDVWPNSD